MQTFYDPFDKFAGLDKEEVLAFFHKELEQTRSHLASALHEVQTTGDHESLCYHFHISCCLLTSFLDEIATFVAKKVLDPPLPGDVYWKDDRTFKDSSLSGLQDIQRSIGRRSIKGGINASIVLNFEKHYLPLHILSEQDPRTGTWDIKFPIDGNNKSGPVLYGLMCPIFYDACAAYLELAKILRVKVKYVSPLV